MGEPVRSAPKGALGAIARRERPRLPIDGFLDRLRPRDPRVAPSRPVGNRVMANSPRVSPLVHVPAELLAPPAQRRATPGRPAPPARLPPLPPTSPAAERDQERMPTAAPTTVQTEPRPSLRSGVPAGLGSPGDPNPSEAPTVQRQPLDAGTPATFAPASRAASPAARAIGASTAGNSSADRVRVVRGRPAEEHAARHAARATSTGDTVHLPDRHGPLGTPEADALLAHELVHVHARRRAPATDVATPAAQASEERVARVVESEVRQGRRPAPRTSWHTLAPTPQHAPFRPADEASIAVGRRDEPLGADRALPQPRDLGRANTGRAPGDALAAPQPRTASQLAPASDQVVAPSGGQAGSSHGPGSPFVTAVSRAPEAPVSAAPTPGDDQQLDGSARLFADRLRDELVLIRERGGGVLDLSRW